MPDEPDWYCVTIISLLLVNQSALGSTLCYGTDFYCVSEIDICHLELSSGCVIKLAGSPQH